MIGQLQPGDGGQYVHPSALARHHEARAQVLPGFDVDPAGTARSAAPSGDAAGLVTYKTKQGEALPLGSELLISFGESVLAENRVKRLKRAVWASGYLHPLADRGSRPPVPWFVTLTYALADDWSASHIRAAVERFRQWCRRNRCACRYTWVAEIQPERCKRTGDAVVHYHLMAWLPVGLSMPDWDRPLTTRGKVRPCFWPHGMTQGEKARTGVGYLMKYLSKLGEFHRFPKGLRLYGIGGLDAAGKSVRQWFNLPQWAKNLHGVGDLTRAAAGLVVRATGEVLSTPWAVRLVPGGLLMSLVGTLAPRLHDGAYSLLKAQS